MPLASFMIFLSSSSSWNSWIVSLLKLPRWIRDFLLEYDSYFFNIFWLRPSMWSSRVSTSSFVEFRAIFGSISLGLGLPALIDQVPSIILCWKCLIIAFTCYSCGASIRAPYSLYRDCTFFDFCTPRLPFGTDFPVFLGVIFGLVVFDWSSRALFEP